MDINPRKNEVCHIFWHTFFHRSRTIVILFALLILVSCTIEIPFDVESMDKRLVVNSVFNTQHPFEFHFSTTESPVITTGYLKNDLQLILYENDIVVLDTQIISGKIITSIIPRPNRSYNIEIISEDYPTVSAKDTIPRLVGIDNAAVIIPAGIDEYGDVIAEAQISFTDPGEEVNYYELLLYSVQEGQAKNYWQHSGDSKIIDPVLINEGDMDYLPSSYFFSDEFFDGQEYTMRIRSKGGGFGPENGVSLRSISRAYYKYRKYYTRHANNQQFQGDFLDIIFMGEPQNMYTNIENGYGIFVGFQETSRLLIPK